MDLERDRRFGGSDVLWPKAIQASHYEAGIERQLVFLPTSAQSLSMLRRMDTDDHNGFTSESAFISAGLTDYSAKSGKVRVRNSSRWQGLDEAAMRARPDGPPGEVL